MATKLEDPFGNPVWVRRDSIGQISISDVNRTVRIHNKCIPELIRAVRKLAKEGKDDG